MLGGGIQDKEGALWGQRGESASESGARARELGSRGARVVRQARMVSWAYSLGRRHAWAEVKESATAFESDLVGGGGRSSIGDRGATMRRGRGLTEAGKSARVRRGWDGNMPGDKYSLTRKAIMGCWLDRCRGRMAAGWTSS